MPLVVGVSFRRVGKVYYFDPGQLQLHEGDFVIAETARGVEFGEVVLEPRDLPDEELVAPLKRVVRPANGDDLEREASNREREAHAYEVCERKIAEHRLPMKLLEAEFAFDGSQVTFSFSADGRVDFRDLVKDVASALKTKVQLHQIGVRDEAKLIGGYGTCGRPLCCATFLSAFDPISMKMAKDQSLFLNPAKFSGSCGKLMCCLRYEHEFYKRSQKCFPSVGAILQLEQGRAKVVDVNFISGVVTLQTEDEVQVHMPASKLSLQGLCRRHGIACTMSEQHCELLQADADICDAAPEEPEDAGEDAEPDAAELVQPDEAAVAIARSKAERENPPPTANEAPKPANGEAGPNRNRRNNRNGRWRGRRPGGSPNGGPPNGGGEPK
jgi:cell fate regulator YaaT (PSP1 superfamily)